MTSEMRRVCWTNRSADQGASGLSVRAWSMQEGVNYATFSGGRLKVKQGRRKR